MRAHDERLGRRVKAHERVAAPLANPYDVRVVDEDGVGHRAVPRQLPFLPRRAVVARDLTRVPLAHPYPALGIAPHPTGALSRGWGCENDRRARLAHHASAATHATHRRL